MLLGAAFANVFLSTAHISEYVEAKRRPQKWKIGRQKKKIPSGKDLKLIFKNVWVEDACWGSIKVRNTIEGFCSEAEGLR